MASEAEWMGFRVKHRCQYRGANPNCRAERIE